MDRGVVTVSSAPFEEIWFPTFDDLKRVAAGNYIRDLKYHPFRITEIELKRRRRRLVSNSIDFRRRRRHLIL